MKALFLFVGLVLLLVALTPALLRRLIRRRLGGYIRSETAPDLVLPERLQCDKAVAVIGAGIAGLTAATVLARRGYRVTVLEKNEYLGGKLGSWPVELEPGRVVSVSHGFHAFFPHYYNLNRFLDSLGLRNQFVSIGDYVIVGKSAETLRFQNLSTTPVFNLLSLMRAGMFSLFDAIRPPGRDLYGVFLEYEEQKTFAEFDSVSYAEFSRVAKVPPRLKLAFNTFARAFFAEEDRLSFAELIKAFHFYYLSQDGGLIYDFPAMDYEEAFLLPISKELRKHGATIETGRGVFEIERRTEGFVVDGRRFDDVVVATDVVGARKILASNPILPEEARQRFEKLRPGQRYSVYRIWLDQDPRQGIPIFVITERTRVLDSVTFYHRFEKETLRDLERVRKQGGEPARAVLELHCYSVPDDLRDEQVKEALLRELFDHFPEIAGASVLHEHFELRQDFTAFHVGMYGERPPTDTGVEGLYCAGDWVKLPFPAMLLEAACSSGLLAANRILKRDGLRQEKVMSVPLRGLMAGMKSPPGRNRALSQLAPRSSPKAP